MTNTARDLIFISHAAPENNEFAKWLTLQLARRGFVVWCDVTKLIGGEKFWQDIEEALRERAVKFLFCASKTSIVKPGVLRELNLAEEICSKIKGNFIIPLKIDDVSFAELPSGMGATTNVIRFDLGWASGLRAVVEMLERDGVLPSRTDGAQLVNDWWREYHPLDEGMIDAPDLHYTNIFPVSTHPEFVWLHPVSRRLPKKADINKFSFPIEPFFNGFLTFADPLEASSELAQYGYNPKTSKPINLKNFIEYGNTELEIASADAQRRIYSLIRQAFSKFRKSRQLEMYELANEAECYWLKLNTLKNDEVQFTGIDGKIHGRALVGFKSIGVTKDGIKNMRYWHFAVQARPLFAPVFALGFRSHVVFTQDGSTLIDSAARQHSARRSQCALWWNDTWRDRLLAMVGHFANGKEELRIPLSCQSHLVVANSPLKLTANKAYKVLEPQKIEELPYPDEDWDNSDEEGGAVNGVA